MMQLMEVDRVLIETCRSCDSTDLETVVDLGYQWLSDFRPEPGLPEQWPLQLVLCRACGLAQLSVTTPRELLYHDRYGFYSGVNEGIRRDLQSIVRFALRRFDVQGPREWLDVGCNDGTLLSFVPEGVTRVGVDPVSKFAELARQHADAIEVGYFNAGAFDKGQFDVVTSISMFYDLEDPRSLIEGVKQVLAPDGVWVIQQNYLPSMLTSNAVDNICHEHITYWAMKPLVRLLEDCGMTVVDVYYSPINGGSFRVSVCHEGRRFPRPMVYRWVRDEGLGGFDQPESFRRFEQRVGWQIDDLRALVQTVTSWGEKVYIYGASTRGAVIWQAAGLGPDLIQYAVERNPDKVGLWYSPIGVPIISEEQAREDRPEYMLVGPWWFRDQIVEREAAYLDAGGKLVFPLPEFEVVSR